MNRRMWALVSVFIASITASWAVTAQEPSSKGEPVQKSAQKEKAPRGEAAPKAEATGLRLALGQRTATAETRRNGLGHTSTPQIDVTEPRADILEVAMTGTTAAAGLPCGESFAEVAFDLTQNFKVVSDRPDPRGYRLVMEGRLIGLFRGNREGAGVATITVPAEATVSAGGAPIVHLGFQGRSHSGKETVVISEHSPVFEAVVGPGEYCLTQRFAIRCSHPKKCFHKNVVMAVFGDAGRAPEWLSILDPTRDLPKGRELGFRVELRVEPLPLLLPPQPSLVLPPPSPVPAP